MKITIEESPYGDTGKTYEGMLGFMNHLKLQLESFRHPGKTPEEAKHLEDDIAGYDELLKSNSEDTVRKFMEIKQNERRLAEPKFRSNIDIVNYMKENGLWVST